MKATFRSLIYSGLTFFIAATGHTFVQGWSDFAMGLGTLTHGVGRVASSSIGETKKFEFRPTLLASYRYEMSAEWSFIPEVTLSIPESSDDETHTTLYASTMFPVSYHLENWVFRFGPGFFFTRISGKGGTLTVQNGTSSSSFPVPNGTATTRTLTWNAGAQMILDKDWSARFDLSALKLFDSQKRMFNYLLSLNYHFGAIL